MIDTYVGWSRAEPLHKALMERVDGWTPAKTRIAIIGYMAMHGVSFSVACRDLFDGIDDLVAGMELARKTLRAVN